MWFGQIKALSHETVNLIRNDKIRLPIDLRLSLNHFTISYEKDSPTCYCRFSCAVRYRDYCPYRERDGNDGRDGCGRYSIR